MLHVWMMFGGLLAEQPLVMCLFMTIMLFVISGAEARRKQLGPILFTLAPRLIAFPLLKLLYGPLALVPTVTRCVLLAGRNRCPV